MENGFNTALSVFNDKLLIANSWFTKLLIYSYDGRHLSTITINESETLYDAAWTPFGNIVVTTWTNHKVVLISDTGKIITAHTQMTQPSSISVSNNFIIYIADLEVGVYQSTDDGVSWALIFKPNIGWRCWQVIDVTIDNMKDFWMLEGNALAGENRISVYSVYEKHTDGNVTRRNIGVPKTNGARIDLSYSVLVYDGNMNIFLNDYENKAFHVLSVNYQYRSQLLSSHYLEINPRRLTVDKRRHLLYVVQEGSVTIVEVFKLTYEDG